MLRITLAQMRRSVGRLVAAGIAIALGTGFVAATLIGMSAVNATVYNNLTASYAGADFVVRINPEAGFFDGDDSPATAQKIAELPGVAAVHDTYGIGVRMSYDNQEKGFVQTEYGNAMSLPTDPRLINSEVTSGHLPSKPGEIALSDQVAEALGLTLGDSVKISSDWFEYVGDETEDTVGPELELVVVGTTSQFSLLSYNANSSYVWPSDLDFLAGGSFNNASFMYSDLIGTYEADADRHQANQAIQEILAFNQILNDPKQAADAQLARFLPASLTMGGIVLIFALISLAVASMVIANTFQVLVAQRTRTLAMLRCVGASNRQIRQSVRIEATLLGGISALAGTAFAWLLMQGGLMIARSQWPEYRLPTVLGFSWLTIVVPVVVGSLIAFLASKSAAYSATRVPALAALRPLDPPSIKKREGKIRLAISLALLAIGALGVVVSWNNDYSQGGGVNVAMIGVLGCISMFTGVLLSIPFWLPKALNWCSRPFKRTGPMSRLAIANAHRNPRRTSATSAALLIGVTLVTTVSVGASIGKASIGASLDDAYAVDLQVNVTTQQAIPLEARLRENSGIAAVTRIQDLDVILTTEDGKPISMTFEEDYPEPSDEFIPSTWIAAADISELDQVVRNDSYADHSPGDVYLSEMFFITDNPDPESWTDAFRILTPGEFIYLQPNLVAWDDETHTNVNTPIPGLTPTKLRAFPVPKGTDLAVVDFQDVPEAFLANTSQYSGQNIWFRLADGVDEAALIKDLQDNVLPDDAWLSGSVQERLAAEYVIDILLKVVYGLLAIAILIAIVGVTNTLTLSVLERKRESATLRAIGLSVTQLQRSLSIEGVFIAAAGAFLGLVIGSVFGWLGLAMLVPDPSKDLTFALPWATLAITFSGAVLAGLLASWVPARMATRTSPVEALAAD